MIKRILPLIPVAVFPFTFWIALGMLGGTEPPPVNPLALFLLAWLLGLVGAVITILQALRGRWQGRGLALASLLIKLLQIQNYVAMFFTGLAGTLFFLMPTLIPLIVFTVDVMTIILSGLVGLAAVIRCRMEGRLTARAAVVNGILQFVFCADVFSAIWVYFNSKEASLS